MNTITFEDLEKSFQSLAGLSSLDGLDKFFIVNNMNRRLREAWNRAKWPDLTKVDDSLLFETAQGNKSTAPLTADVLNVFDFHPWKDIQYLHPHQEGLCSVFRDQHGHPGIL